MHPPIACNTNSKRYHILLNYFLLYIQNKPILDYAKVLYDKYMGYCAVERENCINFPCVLVLQMKIR